METTVVNPEPVIPHKKVHKEFNLDASNNVDFVPLAGTKTVTEVQTPVIVKEVSTGYTRNNFRRNSFASISLPNLMSFLFRGPPMEYRQRQWWRPQQNSLYRISQVGL